MTGRATALRFTPIAARRVGDPRLDSLHADLRRADEAWRGARAHGLDEDLVRDLARDYLDLRERYQIARWGQIRSRVSLSDLLR